MGTVNFENDMPICDMCDSLMSKFDGVAWYTCPECGNSVRITEGEVKWNREIFGKQAATYGGRKCEFCGEPLSGGEHTGPWEDGDNVYGYIKCPHCGEINFDLDDD